MPAGPKYIADTQKMFVDFSIDCFIHFVYSFIPSKGWKTESQEDGEGDS